MSESLWKKLDNLPDYSIMHKLKDLQGSQQPINCLNGCGKFIRMGKFGENPDNDPDRRAGRWFCSRRCLYEYAWKHRVEVRTYDHEAMMKDMTRQKR